MVMCAVNPDELTREEDYAAAMMATANLMIAAESLGLGTYLKTGGIMRDPGLARAGWAGARVPGRRGGQPGLSGERRSRPGGGGRRRSSPAGWTTDAGRVFRRPGESAVSWRSDSLARPDSLSWRMQP